MAPLCEKPHIYTNLLSKTSHSCFFPLNPLRAIVLLLFANVITLRQGYGNLLAPVARSELLIFFSVHVTFAKAQHPKPAFLEEALCQTMKRQ